MNCAEGAAVPVAVNDVDSGNTPGGTMTPTPAEPDERMWAESLSSAAAGEWLWHSDGRRALEPVVIAKVGRKLIHINAAFGYSVGAFRIEDGTYNGRTVGYGKHVITEAGRLRRERMSDVGRTAREIGIEKRLGVGIADEDWEAIVEFAAARLGHGR